MSWLYREIQKRVAAEGHFLLSADGTRRNLLYPRAAFYGTYLF
jgi:hypothetical protein